MKRTNIVITHLKHNAVGYLALVFALSGTAVAATPMLTGAKIQDGTLNGADLRDRHSSAYPGPSIQGQDLEANTITGAEIDESTLSFSGPPPTHNGSVELAGMANQSATTYADPTLEGRQSEASDPGQKQVLVDHDFVAKEFFFAISPKDVGATNARSLRFMVNGAVARYQGVPLLCNFDGGSDRCDFGDAAVPVSTGDVIVLRIDSVGPNSGGDPFPAATLQFSWKEAAPGP